MDGPIIGENMINKKLYKTYLNLIDDMVEHHVTMGDNLTLAEYDLLAVSALRNAMAILAGPPRAVMSAFEQEIE